MTLRSSGEVAVELLGKFGEILGSPISFQKHWGSPTPSQRPATFVSDDCPGGPGKEDTPHFFSTLTSITLRELQTRPNSHLLARDAPKDQNKHVQIRAPTPSSVSSEQEQTYTNSHPPRGRHSRGGPTRGGGANLGRSGARRNLIFKLIGIKLRPPGLISHMLTVPVFRSWLLVMPHLWQTGEA